MRNFNQRRLITKFLTFLFVTFFASAIYLKDATTYGYDK
jgi:hypothetical protein